MTLAQTGAVMDILAAAYPRYYANISGQRRENALKMWGAMFEDDDVRLVCAAVKSFVESDERGFPPVPGQIKAKIRLITSSEEQTEMEAWGIVAKALRNSGYGAKEEFDRFPPIIQRIVGSPAQLREWSMMDSATVHSVVASNFQRSYKAIAAREKEFGMLPPDVKELVSSLRLAQKTMPELREKAPGPLPDTAEDEEVVMPDAIRRHIADIRSGQGRPDGSGGKKQSREDIARIIAALRNGETDAG